MHEPTGLSRGQLSFTDRTASNALPPLGLEARLTAASAGAGAAGTAGAAGGGSASAGGAAAAGVEPPPGLLSQPSQATQEPGTQQPASSRQPLDLRKTAAITAQIANVQIRDDEMGVSQEAGPSSRPPMLQRGFSTNSRLTVEVATRMPSQDMMCSGSFDYATPVDQQFQFDYDLSMQNDQRSRSPAASPVRHVTKRPRHTAAGWGLEDGLEATSLPSQPSQAEPGPSSMNNSGCTFSLPPVPSRGLTRPSRFGGPGRPVSPASFSNPFRTGGDGDLPHQFDARNPRQCPTVSRLNAEFKQVKELGRGGFSVVFRATHRIDGCEYALKRTKSPVGDNKERNAWLQEVQALAAVGAHPCIVQYYSAWAEPDMQGDHLYIQMELCGDSLAAAARLRDKQAWREAELVGLLKQMASALDHMHKRGIVHLDLKPDNIYTARDGSGGSSSSSGGGYKLGDFGLATLRNGAWRVVEGDSRYLPPELLNNDHTHLDKADVFSLGCTLYELSTGQALPANGKRYTEIRQGKLAMLPAYSTHYTRLLASMMAEDPAKRPSAEEILRSVASMGSKNGLALSSGTRRSM